MSLKNCSSDYYCMASPPEKFRRKLSKDGKYCFEQILESAAPKMAAVQLLASRLMNHPSKTKNGC